jgi:hypothetical protein
MTDDKYAACLDVARERARRLRPVHFWLRGVASLLHAGIVGGVGLVIWTAVEVVTWRWVRRLRA